MTSITTRQATRSTGLQPAIVLKNICIDRSGSMTSFGGQQYAMTEELLLDSWKQARESNIPTQITLKTFDDQVETMLNKINPNTQNTPSLQIIRENLHPRGSTKLNDTILNSLIQLEEDRDIYLNSLSNEVRGLNPTIVQILVVITDGYDNQSDSTKDYVKDKILEFREQGGEAILMAANMDAQVIGSEYGFNIEQCLTVHNSDQEAIQSGFRSLGTVVRGSSLGIPTSFTQTQRVQSQNISQMTPTVPISRPLNLLPMPTLTRQTARLLPTSPNSIMDCSQTY
jgi:hypothetical protein